MKHFRCFLLVSAVLFSAVSAAAQDATLFGGFHHPGAITLTPAAGGVGDAAGTLLNDPKDFGVFGVRLYRSAAPVGIEHTLAYAPNFLDSDAYALIYNTNLRVELPAPVFRPYATAGLGLVRAGGDGPAALGTKFAFNYGGGLKLTVLPRVGIRLDVRGYSIRSVQNQSPKVLESSVGIFFNF